MDEDHEHRYEPMIISFYDPQEGYKSWLQCQDCDHKYVLFEKSNG